jgi:hypothetical protein
MNWQALDQLREMVQAASNFSEVWSFFLDHFGVNEEFLSLGRPTANDALAALLEEAFKTSGQKHLQRSRVRVRRMLLIELPEQKLVHGPAMIDRATAGVFYFTDLGVGMIALSQRGSGWAHFSRFTLNVIRDDAGLFGN